MFHDTKILQCAACLPREEMSMDCLCIAGLLQFLLAALKGWTKVLHGTTSHSGHCPGQEKHRAFFSPCMLVGFFPPVKQNKNQPTKQKNHQGSGEDHVQLGVILT